MKKVSIKILCFRSIFKADEFLNRSVCIIEDLKIYQSLSGAFYNGIFSVFTPLSLWAPEVKI